MPRGSRVRPEHRRPGGQAPSECPPPAVGRAVGEQGGSGGDRREDDRQRRGDALVRLTGAAEEPEDRDGQRGLLGPGDEDGGAELAEGDCEGEPGCDGERSTDER